jgi:phosphoglycerate kinase
MISFLTLDDAVVTHQNVLIRLDLNLPMHDGHITDTTRIERCLPTLRELIRNQAKVIILSHYGRPKGTVNPAFSLKTIAEALKDYINAPIHFVEDCIGPKVQQAVDQLNPGEILVLENLRFYGEEEANDENFARQLASIGHLFVNDAFSCSHRAHASVVGLTQFLPSYGGRSMEAELTALNQVMGTPKHPVMAIVGGSKVSTKLDLLTNLIAKMDFIVIGGGMANTFLKAQGHGIGASLVEDAMIPTAQNILKAAEHTGCKIILPMDVTITRELKPGTSSEVVEITAIQDWHIIADMGPQSIQHILQALDSCQTVVWNGPVGVFEIPPFDQGSVAIARHIAMKTPQGLTSVAGGGDTLAALKEAQCGDQFTYTSTAGGAFLEWLEGKVLPGVEALSQTNKSSSVPQTVTA